MGRVVRGRLARVPLPAVEDLSEAQRVEHGDRSGADREDVAQDAPDAGRRPLEWLHRARMVVGLDLEGAHHAAADIHGARVLAGAHHHVRPLRGQRAQQLLGVLVGAVLAPQQRVHRELNLVRRPALVCADQLVLGAREPERDCVLDDGEHGAVRHRSTLAASFRLMFPEARARGSQTCAFSGRGLRGRAALPRPRHGRSPLRGASTRRCATRRSSR